MPKMLRIPSAGARDLSTGSRSKNGLREMDWSYYDTHVMAAGTVQYRFFTSGLAGSAKTLDLTNMRLNGQIPTGERLTIMRLKMFYTSSADIADTAWTNLFVMFARTTIEVKVSGADSVLTITLQELLGNPLQVSQTALAGSNTTPNARFHGVFPFNKPLIYSEQETVEVLMTHQVAPNASLNGHFLKLCLSGILERKLS